MQTSHRPIKIHNKKEKLYLLFSYIEQNDLAKVEEFFAVNPEMNPLVSRATFDKNLLKAPNDWQPYYYAARFGYLGMLSYFLDTLQLTEKTNENLHFLILLNIHSDNLEVNYYLLREFNPSPPQICTYFTTAIMMKKFKLSLAFLMRQAMICEDMTYRNNHGRDAGTEICYNMSYALIPDGDSGNTKKAYFNHEGAPLSDNDILSERENEKKVLKITNQNLRRFQESIRILEKFKKVNFEILEALRAKEIKEKAHSKTRWFELTSKIKSTADWASLVEKYNGQ